MRREQTIWVRNNGLEAFTDRFNGENFEIPPGGVEEMTIPAAELCLGFGQDDKTRCLRRKGWAFSNDSQQAGLKRLAEFSFHMTEKEALEHDPKNKAAGEFRGGEVHSSAPVVDGAAGGESSDAPPAAAVQKKRAGKSPLEKLAAATSAAG